MDNDYVKLDITCYTARYDEKRFNRNVSINELCNKLELLVGITADSQQLELYADGSLVKKLSNADRDSTLATLLPPSWDKLRLNITDVNGAPDFWDESVPKFELTDEQYANREESLLAYKMKHKLGRFDEDANRRRDVEQQEKERLEAERASTFKIDDRCEVRVVGQPTRRGSIKFLGETQFKEGTWVGVQLDEPLGKNDGSVGGVRYFKCPPKYGSFVKPTDVSVGDFPPEEDGLDDL